MGDERRGQAGEACSNTWLSRHGMWLGDIGQSCLHPFLPAWLKWYPFFTTYSRSQRLVIQEVKRDIIYRRMGQPPSAQQVTLIRRDWPRISIPLYPGSTHTYNTLALSNRPNPRKFYNIIEKSISTEQNS